MWRGMAYFRKHGRVDLIEGAEPSEEATLHVAPNKTPFKITIEGNPGAARGKGNPNPRPTIGRRGLVRAQWLRAEGGTLAAAYDRFIKTLDDSLLALALDFPKLVSFGDVSGEQASEEHYQVFGCSSSQWNLPYGSSLLAATGEGSDESGTEDTGRVRVMGPGCFGIVVAPSAGPPPVPPPQADSDEEDSDEDGGGSGGGGGGDDVRSGPSPSFNEGDSDILRISMLGRKMSFMRREESLARRGTESKKDDEKQHVVRTITETTRVVSGMIRGKPTAGTIRPTDGEEGEKEEKENTEDDEDDGEDLDEDLDEDDEGGQKQEHRPSIIDWSFMRRKERASVDIKKKKKEKRLHSLLRKVSLSKPRSSASIERLRQMSRGTEATDLEVDMEEQRTEQTSKKHERRKETTHIKPKNVDKFNIELANHQREALKSIEMKRRADEEKEKLTMESAKAERAEAAQKRMEEREAKASRFRSPKKSPPVKQGLPKSLAQKRVDEREIKLGKFSSPKKSPSSGEVPRKLKESAEEEEGEPGHSPEEIMPASEASEASEAMRMRRSEKLPDGAPSCTLQMQSTSSHKLVLDIKEASTRRGAPVVLSEPQRGSELSSRSRSPKRSASPAHSRSASSSASSSSLLNRALVPNQTFLLDAKTGVVAPHHTGRKLPGNIRKTHEFIIAVKDGVPDKVDAAVVTWTPHQLNGQELKGGFETIKASKTAPRKGSMIALNQQWVLTAEGFLASKLPPGGVSTNLEDRAGAAEAGRGAVAEDINAFVLGMPSTYTRIFPSAGIELVMVPRASPRALRWEVVLPGGEFLETAGVGGTTL